MDSEKVKSYWDNTARATKSSEKALFDNFQKRRVLGEALFKYDLFGAKVVELGTGLGLSAHLISMSNGRMSYTGLDISENYAELAKGVFGLNIKICDFTKGLPFKDDAADCIFAFDVLEHVHPDDKIQLFKEIDRILCENRIIFINNPLNPSGHLADFDFEFNEQDIANLCKATGTIMIELKLLQAHFKKDYYYQFIVLGKNPYIGDEK